MSRAMVPTMDEHLRKAGNAADGALGSLEAGKIERLENNSLVCFFVCLFVCLFVSFFVSLFLCFFVCFFASLFLCFFLCFFVSLFLCEFVSLFLCFFVSLCACFTLQNTQYRRKPTKFEPHHTPSFSSHLAVAGVCPRRGFAAVA